MFLPKLLFTHVFFLKLGRLGVNNSCATIYVKSYVRKQIGNRNRNEGLMESFRKDTVRGRDRESKDSKNSITKYALHCTLCVYSEHFYTSPSRTDISTHGPSMLLMSRLHLLPNIILRGISVR